ncbi:uncharacterized protein METZ01_LOCUS233360 [marine metagenome]|uniref:Uncharacterized protein n=1 Tax=marine metagenome TaxID=408172 RepID=A0A382GZK2_9ZZZZ
MRTLKYDFCKSSIEILSSSRSFITIKCTFFTILGSYIRLFPKQKISIPAFIINSNTVSRLYSSDIAFICGSSLITTPSKPIFFLRRSCIIDFDSVAGYVLSSSLWNKCDTMIAFKELLLINFL